MIIRRKRSATQRHLRRDLLFVCMKHSERMTWLDMLPVLMDVHQAVRRIRRPPYTQEERAGIDDYYERVMRDR